jgi:hypothetical protein
MSGALARPGVWVADMHYSLSEAMLVVNLTSEEFESVRR